MAGIAFGTDGVRGRAFDDLTLDVAFALGSAASEILGGDSAVIGRDTRSSGPALTAAMASGLRSGGVEPLDLGVAPTPAVAFAAAARGSFGVMISASHNPWFDNGIKLFDRDGRKLSDSQQDRLEALLAGPLRAMEQPQRRDAEAGVVPVRSVQRDLGRYVVKVKGSVDIDLGGLSVVLDAANGSGSHIVAPALADLGADVHLVFAEPDGRNINDACGSTHPQALAATVVERSADLGLALDGDADRLLTVDHKGRVVDGDHLMAILAGDLRARGMLKGDRLVVTVMSNLGLLRAMQATGIDVEVTAVGDRSVLEALDRLDASFGGEQSGHLIFHDIAATGDGFLSAVQLMAVLARRGRTLADLAAEAMTSYPQVLRNVPVADELPNIAELLDAEISTASEGLGSDGRILVRPSGTEPVVRVMVEATTSELANEICAQLCDVIERRFGA